MKLHLDLESRAIADLLKTGVYVYAEHTQTEITHVGWSIDDDPVEVWLPQPRFADVDTWVTTIDGVSVHVYGGPMPDMLAAAWDDESVEVVAHNVSFERTMTGGAPGERIGFVRLPQSRWNCTAARAACFGLPRTLEGAAAALDLSVRKDRDGHALMMKMCKPVKPRKRKGQPLPTGIVWVEDLESVLREAAYCAHDVYTERAVDVALPLLPGIERDVWELTEESNDRGILVDADLLLRVAFLIEDAEADVNAKLIDATAGAVKKVSDHGAITRWLQGYDADDDMGDEGVGKAALAAMLERQDLPALVRSVLVMRQEGGKSSAAKYHAILTRLSADGRIRGVLVYAGAAATARWSSRGAQLHNLPRSLLLKKAATVEALIRDLYDGATLAEIEELHGPPLVLASELLRPVFIAADGHVLARGDSKQIEARVAPWIAGAEWKLDAFRLYDAGLGPDLYKIGAGGIYHVSPESIGDEDPRRQVGKVSELALGFGGGWRALQAMARGYGVKIPHADRPADADFDWLAPVDTDEWIVQKWRPANPEMADHQTGIWKQLENAAIECMQTPIGTVVTVGSLGVNFKRTDKVMGVRLPSGRRLFYWSPKLRWNRTPWGTDKLTVIYRAEDSQTKQWREWASYGGLWFQNIVQATARELMAWWLLQMRAAGLAPVLTVHDEGINESRLPADEATALVLEIMKRKPSWAGLLPVSADASAGPRYLKG